MTENMPVRSWTLPFAATAALLGGCANDGKPLLVSGPATTAVAELRTPAGAPAGSATAVATTDGVRIEVAGVGLPPGPHGAHVHTVGRCDAPDFASALGHWNPAGTQHGTRNPQGPHAGDLPNLLIGTDGKGTLAITLPGGTYEGLMDADGAAFIIHAGADDLQSDPAGNSGGRIACGVFRPT